MMDIVLHSDDIVLSNYWEKNIAQTVSFVDDREELLQVKKSVIVMSYSTCKAQAEEVITKLVSQNNRILILDHSPELEKAKILLKYGAKGYGNVLMQKYYLNAAINALQEGMVWLHPSFTSMLINQLPHSSDMHEGLMAKLTKREREVSLLLKEGHTYNEIGKKLSIVPRTVKAHAQKIYTKLDVKDRLGLAVLLK